MADETPVPELLEQPVERAARDVAMRLLERAEKERHRLGRDDDPEALHDFRVAVRRLRSWLKAFKQPLRGSVSGKHRDLLRRVAHATNAGRDAEVHIEWIKSQPEFFRRRRRAGAEWLVGRLEAARRAAAEPLKATADGDFVDARRALDRRLEVYSHRVRLAVPETTFAVAVAERVREQSAGLRRQIEEIGGPGDQERAHAARIAAKHLRYLLEPVALELEAGESLVERLKGLQDMLGALHDAHVFGAEVAQAMIAAAAEGAGRLSRTILDGDPGRLSRRRNGREPMRPGLVAIARRLRSTADASFAEFSAHWRDSAAATFWDDADRAAGALRSRGGAPEEIERKYLLKIVPAPARATTPLIVEQGYLPGKELVERLRRVKNGRITRFYRTVKLGTGMVRTEVEEETTRDVFDRMWPLTKGRRLKKRRHRVREGSLTWEIDVFADRKLVLAEVELPDARAEVEIPDWLRPHLVRDVTDEEEYQNARLAR
jgi:CHAD domain-containing protein/CYTH domain-containing protein